MLIEANKNYSFSLVAARAFFFQTLIFCLLSAVAVAQNVEPQKVKANVELPVWQGYKGVKIGTAADEVRKLLGAPKSEDAEGFFYPVSETETVQVLLDAEKKVRTVSVIFGPEHANQPKSTDVFDKSVTVEAKPDGAAYKVVRYESAGYWVSYSRMAGAKAMVIVVIQKL